MALGEGTIRFSWYWVDPYPEVCRRMFARHMMIIVVSIIISTIIMFSIYIYTYMCVFILNYYNATTDFDDAVVADDCGDDDDDDDIDSNNSNSYYQHTILEVKFHSRCRIWSKSPKQHWSTTTKTPPKTNHGTQENYGLGRCFSFSLVFFCVQIPCVFVGGCRWFCLSTWGNRNYTARFCWEGMWFGLSQINGWNLQPSPI